MSDRPVRPVAVSTLLEDLDSFPMPTGTTVSCGSEKESIELVPGTPLPELAGKLREMLNVTQEHDMVFVDGQQVNYRTYQVTGRERTIDFKKDAGKKGV